MASSKSYGYYIKGNKIAIVQRNSSSSTAPNEDYGDWKSPTEAIDAGLELEYVYGPKYWINRLTASTAGTGFSDLQDGTPIKKLQINGEFTVTEGDYVVVKGAERFNGLHKVATTVEGQDIETTTRYNGATTTESFTVYTDVNPLNNEADELDLPSFLTKGLVYYVKARLAEDQRDEERSEYYMGKYRKLLEQYESSKISGPRILQGFGLRR